MIPRQPKKTLTQQIEAMRQDLLDPKKRAERARQERNKQRLITKKADYGI